MGSGRSKAKKKEEEQLKGITSTDGCTQTPLPPGAKPPPRLTYKVKHLLQFEATDLISITGIDVSANGNILVTGVPRLRDDSGIKVYTVDGEKIAGIQHKLLRAWQMAEDSNGIYVSDLDQACVHRFTISKQGAIEKSFKTCTRLDGDIGFALSKDNIYVTFLSKDRVYSCNKNEEFMLGEWSTEKVVLEQPHYLCVSPTEDVVVSDCGTHSIKVFSKDGELKFSYGKEGSGETELRDPHGVCCDQGGRIYIADNLNNRVCVLTAQGDLVTELVNGEKHGVINPVCVKINSTGDVMVVAHSGNIVDLFKPPWQN